MLIAACAAILLFPGLLNGRPFLFPDSQQYFLLGQRAFEIAFGAAPALEPAATDSAASGAADPVSGASGAEQPAAASSDGGLAAIAGGRSALYSVLLYVTSAKLSMWMLAVLQASLIAWLVVRFCDFAFGQRRPAPTVIVTAALAALTPLGFHVSFMMPDVFAGALVLGILLLTFSKDAGATERLGFAAVVALGANVHATNALLGLAALAIVIALRLWPPTGHSLRAHAAPLLGAAVVAAIAANFAVGVVTRAVTGDEVVSPPYLMARVFADGPGERLLADACAADEDAYAACVFDGAEVGDESDFLWSGRPDRPSFVTLPLEVRAAVKREERAFVIDAIAHDPLGQIAASTGNVLEQLRRVGIRELRFGAEAQAVNPNWGERGILQHSPGLAACLQDNSCQWQKPIVAAWGRVLWPITGAAAAAFLLVLGLWLHARTMRPEIWKQHDPLLLSALLIGAIVLGNAVICGVLSGPQDRYQARLIWLAPLFLMTTSAVWPRALPRWMTSTEAGAREQA